MVNDYISASIRKSQVSKLFRFMFEFYNLFFSISYLPVDILIYCLLNVSYENDMFKLSAYILYHSNLNGKRIFKVSQEFLFRLLHALMA